MLGDEWVAIDVQYYRKYDMSGRQYGTGPCLQKLTKEARAAAMPGCLDMDINNWHASLLLKVALCVAGKQDDHSALPMLRKYVLHHKQWREFVAEYVQISVKEAKKMLANMPLRPRCASQCLRMQNSFNAPL